MTSEPRTGRRQSFWLQAALAVCLLAGAAAAMAGGTQSSSSAIDRALGAAHSKYKGLKDGTIADYIPALASA